MIWFVLEAERKTKYRTTCLQEIQYVCWCMSAVLQEVLMWMRRINIENYSNCNIKCSTSSSHRQWMENTDANTHTLIEYLWVFLLNDQRSDIIASFLIVFGVCAVTVWKLSREQTNTHKIHNQIWLSFRECDDVSVRFLQF